MADALAPWFLDYALSIAETYGANISNVPSHAKGKKVQITEVSSPIRTQFCLHLQHPSDMQFLTYGSEEEDNLLWAQISDKQYIIPVKFTKDAMAQYARQK